MNNTVNVKTKEAVRQEQDPREELAHINRLVQEQQSQDLAMALDTCGQAVRLAEQLFAQDETAAELLARSLFTKAVLNIQMANYAQAIASIYQALPLFPKFEDARLHGRALNALAASNFYLGNTAEGFQFSWDALEIFEKAEDHLWIAAIYGNLGYQYLHMDHYEWAERYLFQAISHLGKQESKKEFADVYDNLCMLYYKTSQYEKAVEYGNQAVQYYAESDYPYGLAEAKNNLGRVYQAMQDPAAARKLHEEALAIARSNNLRYQEVNTLLRLGSLQLETETLETALETLKLGLKLAEAVGTRREAYKLHRLLAQAFKNTGDFATSLAHFEAFYELEKMVLDEKETQRIKSLEIMHQVERARRDAESLRMQSQVLEEQLKAQYEIQADLEMQSITDPLTGLLNRRHFTSMVESELIEAARYGKSVSMVVIDIDHFKDVNDTYGHLVGDHVLAALADILRQELRQRDLIWRYGGEEFVILLPQTTCDHAVNVAERLREQVAEHVFKIGKDKVKISISLGVACSLDMGKANVEQLFNAADQALLQAKRDGRNHVAASTPTAADNS